MLDSVGASEASVENELSVELRGVMFKIAEKVESPKSAMQAR